MYIYIANLTKFFILRGIFYICDKSEFMAERKDIWYAIVNPHSGSGRSMSSWQKAEIRLRQLHVHYTSTKSESQGHAIELAREAASKGYRRFIAVGGDGTVHEVLNGIMHFVEDPKNTVPLSEFTLGVLPVGSGNDWISSHGMPHDPDAVIDIIAACQTSRQDVVKAVQYATTDTGELIPSRTDYMLNIAGIGFDGRVCEVVNARKAVGHSGRMIYFRALLTVLRHFYSFKTKVIADGKVVFDGDCYSMAFGIGPYSGGGMRQVPDAVLDDGLLDMLIIPKIRIPYLVSRLPLLYTGTIGQVPELIYCKAKEIKVLSSDGYEDVEPIEIDGEVVGRFPVCFEVLPSQIKVLSLRKNG